MNIEQIIKETIERIKVMQAFVDRKEVEHRYNGKWVKIHVPSWNWDNPATVLRPWTADEVPLGAWMRSKRNPQDRMLIHWVCSQADREIWLDKNEHSTDGGKTWLPCGVVEEAK